MTRNISLLSTVGLLATLALALPAPAALIGDSWDFGSDTGLDDASAFSLVQQHSSSWGLTADDLRYSNSNSSRGWGSTEFSNFAASNSFTITSRAYYSASNGAWSYVDLLALGTSAAGISSGNLVFDGIVARVGSKGKIDLRDAGGSLNSADTGFNLNGGWFNLTLTGEFDGSDLNLSFTATNDSGTSSKTIEHTITSNTYTGKWFGLGGYGDGNRDFAFDTYSIIPEPASLALMGLGGLLMLGRGRKDRA